MHRPEQSPDVVITAGGTREQIDDVRYVSNFATGELGHTLAETYKDLGYNVTLLAAGNVTERFGRLSGVNHVDFASAADLQQKILGIPEARLILHSAAVSDYTPIPHDGKLSSDQDELIIRMVRVAKILPLLRPHFGSDTTVVGFKLLSGVDESELIMAGQRQIETCGTNLCIANDLRLMSARRRIHILAQDGTYQTFDGSVPDLAIDIAKNIPVPV